MRPLLQIHKDPLTVPREAGPQIRLEKYHRPTEVASECSVLTQLGPCFGFMRCFLDPVWNYGHRFSLQRCDDRIVFVFNAVIINCQVFHQLVSFSNITHLCCHCPTFFGHFTILFLINIWYVLSCFHWEIIFPQSVIQYVLFLLIFFRYWAVKLSQKGAGNQLLCRAG